MDCLLFDYELGGAHSKIYACFEQNTAMVMQNYRNLGAGDEVTIF